MREGMKLPNISVFVGVRLC